VTSEQAIRSLSPAQRKLYERMLAEPAGSRTSRTEQRSASVLVRMGWAEVAPVDAVGVHYRLTDLGKLISGPIAYVLKP